MINDFQLTKIDNQLHFSDVFTVAELQRIQDLFSNATGVASLITQPDGTPITRPTNFCRFCGNVIRGSALGLSNCMKSDAEIGKPNLAGPRVQHCLSAGIWDAGVSIFVGKVHIANWLIGQVRNEDINDSEIEAYADKIGVDREVYKAAYYEVPSMSVDKFKNIAELLFIFANELSEKAYHNRKLEVLMQEQRKIEEELRISEEKYRLLVENQHDLVVKVDKNSLFTYVSPSYCRLFGKSEEELLGNSFLPLVHPDDVESTKEAMKSLYQEAHYCRLEQRAMTAKGWRWLSWNDTAIVNNSGEVEGIIGVGRDITERKRAEQEVKKMNEELRISNAEKEKFFSIIAHDLRGPFNSFLGLTILLADELNNLPQAQVEKLANSMKNMAGGINRLLENLLNWSRIKQGNFPFQPQNVRMKDILESCSETCFEMSKQKSILLNFDFPEGLLVYADIDMLRTILRNLISNALKYTNPEGEVKMVVKKDKNNGTLFCIKDDGIGMSKLMVDSLFKIDKNVSRVGTAGENSTGLGLILCKEFVEKHNGKIWVESEINRGSSFYFTLPGEEN